ncbi:MAG: hypothetical protein JOY82_02365 [Streptosporangiaceae bacterium]|nr:hypothetical protein [Streptosporangiaceae bacterium]MBV9853353.1 hypothetical protein [Streptosporangiaceae bacterium]
MRWIKVAAVVGGALIVFFVLDSLVHLVLGLLTTLVFVALVAGGIAVAVKIAAARRNKEVRGSSRRRDEYEVREEPRPGIVAVPTPPPPAHSTVNVDDELARLKREMGG